MHTFCTQDFFPASILGTFYHGTLQVERISSVGSQKHVRKFWIKVSIQIAAYSQGLTIEEY